MIYKILIIALFTISILASTNLVYSEQFRNYKNFEVHFDLSFGNVENSYRIDKLNLVINNESHASECTGSNIIDPYVAVTDLRSSFQCDIEVIKLNQNIQERTIDKLSGFITFAKEIRDSRADTVIYPEIDQNGMNYFDFNGESWHFDNAVLKFDNKVGQGSLILS